MRPTLAACRQGRDDHRDRDGQRGVERHQQPRLGRRHVVVPEEVGEPAEGDVGLEGLGAEQQRQRPAEPGAGYPPDRQPGRPVVGGRIVRAQCRQPGQHRERGENGPATDAESPTADRVGNRHGQRRGGGGADRQAGGVHGGQRADPIREVPLDQRRHQYVRDGATGQREQRQQCEQPDLTHHRPQRKAAGRGGQGDRHQPVVAQPVRQPRRQEPHAGEGDHRQRGEHAGHAAGCVQAVPQIVQLGSDAGHRHPHGQPGQDQRDQHQRAGSVAPGQRPAHRAGLTTPQPRRPPSRAPRARRSRPSAAWSGRRC